MPELAQLLALHHRSLVLDTASARTFVGLLARDKDPLWQVSNAEAGTGLPIGVRAVLEQSGESLANIDALIVCTGPGSMLGLRTAAMAVRTWQLLRPRAMYAYDSLALAARGAAANRDLPYSVIADARRDSWHVQTVTAAGLAPIERRATANLPPHSLFMPENFRTWSTLPARVTTVSYEVPQLFSICARHDLFKAVSAIEPFHYEAPVYQRWSAQVHSAETVRPA